MVGYGGISVGVSGTLPIRPVLVNTGVVDHKPLGRGGATTRGFLSFLG